jgi:hypothetical protein
VIYARPTQALGNITLTDAPDGKFGESSLQRRDRYSAAALCLGRRQ